MFKTDELELIEYALNSVKNSGFIDDDTQDRIYELLDKIKGLK